MMEFVNGFRMTLFTFWVLHVIVPGVLPCKVKRPEAVPAHHPW
jgi:hypothetical protein